ncbi:MAG: heavy metal translocating P-type ATPase, partial [Eubacterium sp.]|nr:heavy metal translocating P-type ATPase [Candidatus Colimonas fimequi]
AEVVVPVEEVMIGDYFAVRPGESIPVDGIVDEGISAVDEAALTGESIPVDKAAGDVVSAGTINKSGYLVCIATRVGENTAISQIIKMVSDAAATKAPIAKVADKVAGIFVPVVIGIALVVFGIWMACGGGVETALTRAIAVLVISCPCALGLATPVAIMVGNGMGAKRGILFKTAVSLEETGKVVTVVIDKTGTATKGEPVVTDIIPSFGIKEYDLLQVAYSLEALSEHPLAKAVVEYATANHVRTKRVDKFGVLPGNGLMGFIGDEPVCGGNLAYIETQVDVEDEIRNKAEELARDGKTPLFFANETSVIGIIAVADQVKEESDEAIVQLKNMGIKVVMLTGDNALTAAAVGRQLGVDTVYAGVLPDGKENIIRQLSQTGKVAMVGDGINDAPALTRADIGIAIGAGTDVAIDAADIVLMNSNLVDVPAAIRLSRATLKTIHQNLFWAFGYNVICIPIAAGALIPICGLGLSPMIAAACMSLSSFCVVTNALRLNIYDMMDSSKDSANESAASEEEFQVIDLTETDITKKENTMNKTMKIEGMMCMHCEARVKQTLEGLAQVDEAAVSHEANNAVLTLNADISNEELKAAVEAQGYQVVGIE